MISDADAAALKAVQAQAATRHPTPAQQVRQRHENRLMSLPNVNGIGVATDPATGSELIVVYVERKVPLAQLESRNVIPAALEGVPVRVMEIGQVTAQEGPPHGAGHGPFNAEGD
jgi:hypothetical protein